MLIFLFIISPENNLFLLRKSARSAGKVFPADLADLRRLNVKRDLNMAKRKLETCFSPALYEPDEHLNSVVVIIDILRASSAICTAFANGAASILPVADVSEAREYKSRGYLVAAERDGFVLDFADFGNSPFNFTRERVEGKTIVYSTTNGTGIINQASSASAIAIGSFLNMGALAEWIIKTGEGCFIILCRMEKQVQS